MSENTIRIFVNKLPLLIFFREYASDFDVMMAKRKEEMQRARKKRKDVDLINDNDDLIADLIVKMKEAANVCLACYLYVL